MENDVTWTLNTVNKKLRVQKMAIFARILEIKNSSSRKNKNAIFRSENLFLDVVLKGLFMKKHPIAAR